jgi:hypothetical protein
MTQSGTPWASTEPRRWDTDVVDQRQQLRVVAGPPGCQPDRQRTTAAVDAEMGLGTPATAGATQGRGRRAQAAGSCDSTEPPVRPSGVPAACWCARATVESTETTHSRSATACAWPCNSRSTRSQVPSLATGRNATRPSATTGNLSVDRATASRSGKATDRLHHRPVLTPASTETRSAVRQQRLDPGPHLIRQQRGARHEPSLTRADARIRQTRPDM